MSALRVLLHDMTQNRMPHAHPAVVEALAEHFPHSIRLVAPPPNQQDNFTCFQFALGVAANRDVMERMRVEADVESDFCFGAEFVERLLSESCLRPAPSGNVMLYYVGSKPVHAGVLIADGMVRSKWGVGCTWEHPTYEVPESYGSDARPHVASRPEAIASAFRSYYRHWRARTSGS